MFIPALKQTRKGISICYPTANDIRLLPWEAFTSAEALVNKTVRRGHLKSGPACKTCYVTFQLSGSLAIRLATYIITDKVNKIITAMAYVERTPITQAKYGGTRKENIASVIAK